MLRCDHVVGTLCLLMLLLANSAQSESRRFAFIGHRHRAAQASAIEQAMCHRNCQVANQACCDELGTPACDINCARGRFLCRERCGPPVQSCHRRCFLRLFDCLEECSGRGLGKDTCNRQCQYYMSFACLLDCRREQ